MSDFRTVSLPSDMLLVNDRGIWPAWPRATAPTAGGVPRSTGDGVPIGHASLRARRFGPSEGTSRTSSLPTVESGLPRDGWGPRLQVRQLLRTVEARLVADEVATQILSLIGRGILGPGDRLPSEVELARSLGVGRSTVREAKGQLMARGFLKTRGKSGAFVSAPSANAVDVEALVALVSDGSSEQLREARTVVESAAIRLAAKRATNDDLAALSNSLRTMDEPINGAGPTRWERMVRAL